MRLLEILSRDKFSVSELLADLPAGHSTPEIRVDCPDALKEAVVADVRQRLETSHKTTQVDGVRVQYDDGAWALVRASNTGPIIVLRFEAQTAARLSEVRAEVEGALIEARRKILADDARS